MCWRRTIAYKAVNKQKTRILTIIKEIELLNEYSFTTLSNLKNQRIEKVSAICTKAARLIQETVELQALSLYLLTGLEG